MVIQRLIWQKVDWWRRWLWQWWCWQWWWWQWLWWWYWSDLPFTNRRFSPGVGGHESPVGESGRGEILWRLSWSGKDDFFERIAINIVLNRQSSHENQLKKPILFSFWWWWCCWRWKSEPEADCAKVCSLFHPAIVSTPWVSSSFCSLGDRSPNN